MADLTASTTYFALEEGPKLATELMRRVSDCRAWYRGTGRLQVWRDGFSLMYGFDRDGKAWTTRRVSRDAKNASITKVKLNHWASIQRSIVTLVTAQSPNLQSDAEDTKSATEVEAQQVNKLLEHYLKTRWGKYRKKWVRQACRYGTSYFYLGWDYQQGPELANPGPQDVPRDPNTAMPIGIPREGDMEFDVLPPTSVFFDFRRTDADHDWIITERLKNRFDLAARYPQQENAILALSPNADQQTDRLALSSEAGLSSATNDLVPVYEFRHKSTDAVKGGRRVLFLNDELILPSEADFPRLQPFQNPYPDLYVFRLAPEDMDDSPDGCTPMTDLMGPQEAMDAAASHALSKMAASMPVLITPKAANLSKKDIETPFAVVEFAGDKEPKVLVPSVSGGEDMQAVSAFQKHMETLSGVNSVARGNPEEAVKGGSGAAYALIQAQAILAQTDLQQEEIEGTAAIGTAIIECHKRFNRGFSQVEGLDDFSGDSLSRVSRVRAQPVGALQQSVAGRQQLLEALMKMGVQILPDKLIEFLTTGNFETAVEDKFNEQVLIKSENEAMASGQPVRVLASQNHFKHIRGHCAELSTVDMIQSENVTPVRMAHILEHVAVWRQTDPAILMAMNCPPPPPPMLMAGMPGAPMPGAPPPPGAPHPQGPSAGPGGPPKPPGPSGPPQQAQNGGMPHMPKIAGTQQSSAVNSPAPPGVAP